MFLAQIVFSFRSLCLKAAVTDFVLPGTRGEEGRGNGGLLVRDGWMKGKGTEYALTLYFHLRKIGRISVKIHLYPYAPPDYFCDLNTVKFI